MAAKGDTTTTTDDDRVAELEDLRAQLDEANDEIAKLREDADGENERTAKAVADAEDRVRGNVVKNVDGIDTVDEKLVEVEVIDSISSGGKTYYEGDKVKVPESHAEKFIRVGVARKPGSKKKDDEG